MWGILQLIQFFFPDTFIPMRDQAIVFGVVFLLEVIMLVSTIIVYHGTVRGFMTTFLYLVQAFITWITMVVFIGYLYLYLRYQKNAGFNFQVALPSGTGVSANSAFSGTSILPIAINIYINIVIYVLLGIYVVFAPIFGGLIGFIVANGSEEPFMLYGNDSGDTADNGNADYRRFYKQYSPFVGTSRVAWQGLVWDPRLETWVGPKDGLVWDPRLQTYVKE